MNAILHAIIIEWQQTTKIEGRITEWDHVKSKHVQMQSTHLVFTFFGENESQITCQAIIRVRVSLYIL